MWHADHGVVNRQSGRYAIQTSNFGRHQSTRIVKSGPGATQILEHMMGFKLGEQALGAD